MEIKVDEFSTVRKTELLSKHIRKLRIRCTIFRPKKELENMGQMSWDLIPVIEAGKPEQLLRHVDGLVWWTLPQPW